MYVDNKERKDSQKNPSGTLLQRHKSKVFQTTDRRGCQTSVPPEFQKDILHHFAG